MKKPPIESRQLVVTVSVTNLKRRVRGLQEAYRYISGIAGRFDYEIRDWNHPSILIEKGEL